MKTTILHDYDGTFLDSQDALHRAYASYLGKPLEYVRKNFILDWREFLRREGKPEPDRVWWNDLFKSFGPKLFDGTLEYLGKLKSERKIGLVTSSSYEMLNPDLKEYGLEGFFDGIVASNDVKKLKPDPESLLMATKKMNVKVRDCVYVGDASVDAEAAKALGMDFIGVDWGYQEAREIRRVNKDKVVHTFNNLFDAVTKL
jgi:pyrophosphatase PpaX